MVSTHQWTVTVERTTEQRATITVKADTIDEAIQIALTAARRRKDPDITWRHHATASAPAAARDLVVDHGEPDPVLPFRGPGIL
jgi:hypothetical protein